MDRVIVLAHGIVGRQDLPIPRWLFGWGAALVLIVSFVALAVAWREPRLERPAERRLARVPAALEPLCGAIGVALFAAIAYSGLAGAQTPTANLLPTFVFVVFWVGLVPLSLLFGDVFAAFNPWRAIGRGARWAAKRIGGEALPAPLPYPARAGRWPAAVGLVAFAWVELVWTGRDDPSTLALVALAYAAVQLVGMSLYGVEPWTRNADAFAVYFGLLARVAPLRWERGTVFARRPLAGLSALDPRPGTVAVLCAAIGSTTFDGFSEGPTWTSIAPGLTDAIRSLGLPGDVALQIAFTLGLLATVAAVSGIYALGVAGMRAVGGGGDRAVLARSFVHTLVPIACAYVLAHYFSLIAFEGQGTVYLASNPLGDALAPGDGGLLGTAQYVIDYTWVSANAIWYVQVGALVVGHACALLLAHDRALAVYGRPAVAARSQLWMLAVMVAFTSLGLWLLSAANA